MIQRWLILAALSVLFGVVAQNAWAASCIESCQDACPSFSDPYNSRSQCTNNCVSRCSNGGDLIDAAAFGAIAYSAETGSVGWAYNKGSPGEADQLALSNCRRYAKDCKIALRLKHECGAVAAGDSGTPYTGTGGSEDEAENAAMSACRAGKSCAIQAWTCSP